MRYAGLAVFLIVPPLTSLCSLQGVAQQPAAPAPVQTARPLTLPTLRPPVADTGIFSPLPFPAGNEIRRADGAPGPRYWQQRVDYLIRATLDTAAKRISGTESIRYTNNSPDTLRFVWLQLDQNLFRPGSTGSLLFPAESRFGGGGFEGGFDIDSISQCGAAGQRGGAETTRRKRRAKPPRTQERPAPLPRCPSAPLRSLPRSRTRSELRWAAASRPRAPG
jgi:hypothetical protein